MRYFKKHQDFAVQFFYWRMWMVCTLHFIGFLFIFVNKESFFARTSKNILIIGNRCGILDLLYFSCPSANIINLVQSYLPDLQRYNFFDNDLYNNSNISHLKHTNGLDILVENYNTKILNLTNDFISSILKIDKSI